MSSVVRNCYHNAVYIFRLNDERRRYSDKLWVSIMAGVTLSDLNLAINKVRDKSVEMSV